MGKRIWWTREICQSASHPCLVRLKECSHILFLRSLGVRAEDSCLLEISVLISNHPSLFLSFPLILLLQHFAF